MLSLILLASLLVQPSAAEEALLLCTTIQEDARRLACFDEAAENLKGAVQERAAERKEEATERFGLLTPPPDEPRIEEVAFAVTEVGFNRAGKITLTLENGQVWQQLSGSTERIREAEAGRIERVVIKKAAFGSHRATVEPLGESFKVRRLR